MNARPLVIILLLVAGMILLIAGCAIGLFLAPVVTSSMTTATQTESVPVVEMVTTAATPTFPTPLPPTTLQDADAEETLVASIYERVAPSVVHIRVVQQASEDDHPSVEIPGWPEFTPPEDFYLRGEGSGFVWDMAGHVVTNYHVVENAANVEVTFIDGATFTAEVVGTDPDSDLAVLLVDCPSDWLFPVTAGDSDSVFVGQRAIAIGNPFGQEWTLTMGIISAVGRTMPSGASQFSIPEMIQTDTAINPGNSGGPLLDRDGHVIGVNTLILTNSSVSSGVGFAIPVNVVRQVVPSLIESGYHSYAWLGIVGTDLGRETAVAMELSPDQRGALVLEVVADSPAEEAGLRGSTETVTLFGTNFDIGGDVIIAADDEPISDMDDLIVYLATDALPGQQITLTVLRSGEQVQLDVTLAERPR